MEKEKVSESVEFKEWFNMTDEEIKNLDKAVCKVEKFLSKSKKNYFTLEIRLDGFDGSYKLNVSLDENQYNHFVRKHELDPNKGRYVLKLPIRFISGIGKNGIEYHLYQVFLSNKMTIHAFLKRSDLIELDDLNYKINWLTHDTNEEIEVQDEF